MKISLNWLKDYVSITKKPEDLAKELTLKTCEIEEVVNEQNKFEGFFVGKVLKKEKHPNADRLSIAEVDYGQGKETVVCGAPNLEEGQMIVFATAGTTVATGLRLKKIAIRGVESNGMICAEDEVGLSDKHDQIIVLDQKKAKVGMKFSEYLEKDDIVFEVDNKSITHRPDLFSHLGVAREIAAIQGKKFVEPKLQNVKETAKDRLEVKIKDSSFCARYIGVVLANVEVKPSPEFMQKRLEAAGMRPINNIVDIANYVMLEYGQPLHTFDFAKISQGKDKKQIIVRQAKKGEEIVTLDDQKRKLENNDLVIADENNAIAIAGVMGGADSEVNEKTTKIILESANFDGATVRRTSWRLGLRSEAVTRFEKNLPKDLPMIAVKRAIELFEKYANAKVSSKVVDAYSRKATKKTIKLDPEYVTRLLGVKITKAQIKKYLSLLGFKVKASGALFDVLVPWYREGTELAEELIEEIGRLYGGDKIEAKTFMIESKPTEKDRILKLSRDIKQYLYALGLDEMVTYSFYGEKKARDAFLPLEKHLEIANPFSEEAKLMKVSHLPILLEKMALNLPNFEEPRFFEVGHIYNLKDEKHAVTGLIFGTKERVFYEGKGVAETLLSRLGVSFRNYGLKEEKDYLQYEKEKTLIYEAKGKKIGSVALVSNRVLKNFSIKKGFVAVFDFNIESLLLVLESEKVIMKIPKYPEARLDLAFVFKNDIQVEKIEKVIREVGRPLLKTIEVFDVYRGKPLAASEKSVAFHMTYRSEERTLKDAEVNSIREKTENKLKELFEARIRDF